MKTPQLSFKEKVFLIVKSIPRGSVMTYKSVAEQAGNVRSARVVGMYMRSNTDLSVPCHRVVRSDGSYGGYNGLRGKSKEALLSLEGYRAVYK
jgi:O-6-methylguanine DNA methyltransferase